ncbi:hypothetical protein SGLAM104S_05478 [Streptomyces glaucescens]
MGDGASLAVGGFGLSGVPDVLIGALYERGVTGLSVVSNNCGAMESGLANVSTAGRIARVTGSYIGANKEFAGQYLAGELEVELIPQGTLAEAAGRAARAFPPSTPAGAARSATRRTAAASCCGSRRRANASSASWRCAPPG